jgi:broad specificity phosphatase PhoE
LRLLGAGGEGIVFTDEKHVYKVFDLLKRRPNHDTQEILRTLSDRLDQPRHLYPLSRIDMRDETLLVVYPYEPSESYADVGGHGAELVGLLRECKRNGIVFRNLHPKNLRVSASGLKLVDYGSDIRPFSEAGYRSMAERAWLTWRWSHRQDLDQVMRRALTDKSLPELDGVERFWSALCDEKPSATRTVSGIVDQIILSAGARTVLDYGCGKKARSARRLADAGLRAVGFDPGSDMRARWDALGKLPAGLELTTERSTALDKGPFDAVVCSLVLCGPLDGQEYDQVLRDLRSSVQDDGLAFITICNPFASFGGATSLHRRRELPKGVAYADSFSYVENVETDAGRRKFHRPLSRIEADLLRHGLRADQRIESKTVDLARFEPASDFLTLVCRPFRMNRPDRRVSLVIKTCAMEAQTIERQVEHLVGQLMGPRGFHEKILAIDSLRDGFVRQHAPADWEGLHAAARRLQDRGIIDHVVTGPTVAEDVRRLNRDWFGVDSSATHSVRGFPIATPLSAFEVCTGDYILQVDSDLLIARLDPSHDYLGEMIEAIEASPSALTASLNIARTESLPFSAANEGCPWRVEVRGCLFHRSRLLAARPFSNTVVDERLQLSWHRAMDASAVQGRFVSLRGGGHQTFFVHPPNDFKRSVTDWMLLLDLVEKGHTPEKQFGKVDMVGGPLDWVPRNRPEPFIFLITGRNVPPGRVRRCLESIAAQRRKDWGAILIDDGSAAWTRDYLPIAVEPWRDRVTLLKPRERRGQLANMTLAIRHICTSQDSVIVTLDMDDALVGPGVLDRVAAEYNQGADVTVGSMLRTDKHVEYPVTFENPRQHRGGNVWQHLRTFRKRLFDAIPDHELRLDGRYVDMAVDWAFMPPIVEMAKQPAWIREPLYLYEPSGLGKGAEQEARERQIAAIVRKPSRTSCSSSLPSDFIRPEAVTPALWRGSGGIFFIRHGERPSFSGLNMAERDAVSLTNVGREAAMSIGRAVGTPIKVVSSPVLRSRETAEAIAEAAGLAPAAMPKIKELVHFRVADDVLYEAVKSRLGWSGLMATWLDGSLPPGILTPCHEVAAAAIAAVRGVTGDTERDRVVAVTHDFMVLAILATLHGVRTKAVPYLAGVLVTWEQAKSILNTEASQ